METSSPRQDSPAAARTQAASTALAFLPAGVVVAILSAGMGQLIGRFGPVPITVIAFACLVAGSVSFLRVGGRPDYPGVILPAVIERLSLAGRRR